MKTPKVNKKKAYASVSKLLLDKYNRNLITLEQYKFELAFTKGQYGIK